MLGWTKGAKRKCRRQTKFIYSYELFRHEKFKFFVTKTFVTKGADKNTISDENHFVANVTNSDENKSSLKAK